VGDGLRAEHLIFMAWSKAAQLSKNYALVPLPREPIIGALKKILTEKSFCSSFDWATLFNRIVGQIECPIAS
jgi:hypothetical protein